LQKDLGLLELLNANNLIHFSSRNQNNETVIDVAKKQYKKSDSLLKKMFNKKEIALLQNICKFLEDSQSKYNDYLYLRQTSRILDGIIFADKTNHIPEITHIVDSYLDEKKTNWYDQEIKKLKPRSVISGSVYQQFQESEENLEI
jgi:hypothetical protein